MFLSRNEDMGSDQRLTIDNTDITSSDSINILGVELDKNLKLNLHIDEICSQAGKQMNAVKRIKHYLGKNNKMTIYNSYINSNFSHYAVVWMFTCKSNAEKQTKG